MFQTYIDFFGQIASTNIASLILATIAMVSIHLVKEYVNPKVKAKIKMPVPVELIWVIPVLFVFIVFLLCISTFKRVHVHGHQAQLLHNICFVLTCAFLVLEEFR